MARRGEETWTWRLSGKTDDGTTSVCGHPFWYCQLSGEGAIVREPVEPGRLFLPPFPRLRWKEHCTKFQPGSILGRL